VHVVCHLCCIIQYYVTRPGGNYNCPFDLFCYSFALLADTNFRAETSAIEKSQAES